MNGSWSRVCGDGDADGSNGNRIATTVCTELGYSHYGNVIHNVTLE